MLGMYGHASAREHLCFLRLKEECGGDIRFYQIGDNPIVTADTCCVPISGKDLREDARTIRNDGIDLLLVTDTLYLQE